MRRQPVDDGAHRMFSHPEVQVTAGPAPATGVAALRVFARNQRRVVGALCLQSSFG